MFIYKVLAFTLYQYAEIIKSPDSACDFGTIKQMHRYRGLFLSNVI